MFNDRWWWVLLSSLKLLRDGVTTKQSGAGIPSQMFPPQAFCRNVPKAKGDDSVIMSPEQQNLIEQFRDDKVKIRKDLRSVRRELNQDIEGVESFTKVMNIGVVPIVVALAGIFIGLVGMRRRRRIADAATARVTGAA